MTPTFTFVPLASSLHDAAAVGLLLGTLSPGLEALGGRRAAPGQLDRTQPCLLVVLTGGTEQLILAEASRRPEPGAPVLLVVHPGHNALAAALEALARLQQDGGAGRVLLVGGEHDGWPRVAEAVQDAQAWLALRRARIGLVGLPSDWLVASSPSPEVVRRRWGPEVVAVDLDAAIARMAATADEPAVALADAYRAGAAAGQDETRPSPPRADVIDAARVLPTLEAIVAAEGLDAITVRCFDLLTRLRTSGCIALAELNDRGITAGCEGDMVSTVAMLWTRLLLGQTTWMANPAWADEDSGTLTLAHCTVARRLVDRYRLRTHFESGLGVGIEGDMPAGPATLVRIGGRDLDRLWVVEGELTPGGHDESLCRTQVVVHLGPADLGGLLARPLGNHVLVVRGRHRRRLHDWWSAYVAPAQAAAQAPAPAPAPTGDGR